MCVYACILCIDIYMYMCVCSLLALCVHSIICVCVCIYNIMHTIICMCVFHCVYLHITCLSLIVKHFESQKIAL